eukprot:scaffold3059_cov131-Amphora_coffeaeformis.AAC.2
MRYKYRIWDNHFADPPSRGLSDNASRGVLVTKRRACGNPCNPVRTNIKSSARGVWPTGCPSWKYLNYIPLRGHHKMTMKRFASGPCTNEELPNNGSWVCWDGADRSKRNPKLQPHRSTLSPRNDIYNKCFKGWNNKIVGCSGISIMILHPTWKNTES